MARLWTLEQLKALHDFEYEPVPGCKVVLIPISKGSRAVGYGSSIVWDARIYRQGVMGPRQLSKDELVGAGVAEDEAERIEAEAKRALGMLSQLYPVLLPRVERLRAEIETAVKAIEERAASVREKFESS